MRKLASTPLAVVAGLALSSCASSVSVVAAPGLPASVAPIHSLATPDAPLPAAGVCGSPGSAEIVTFTLNIDTPNPRCDKVLPAQRLRVVNATSSTVTFTFDGSDYDLEPRAEQTVDKRFGAIWQPGVYLLHTSLYGGGGPEIWLV